MSSSIMPDTEIKMEEGVIAFLDALGMKGIWSRTKPERVVESWNAVIGTFLRHISRFWLENCIKIE